MNWQRFTAIIIISLSFEACSGPVKPASNPYLLPPNITSAGSNSVALSWNPNHETAVNSPGGGYKIYYSTTSGFSLSSASSLDVPYSSGGSAPTTATLPALATGTYYIQVVAYSPLNLPGASGGTLSQPSTQISVTVP